MIWRISFFVSIFLFSKSFRAQTYSLSSELKEISGLEVVNDTLLVAHNDGGNSPHLYLLNLQGKEVKKVLVSNAINTDWEDLAADDKYLYVGDFGNNRNNRKDLRIYRVKIEELLKSNEVFADEMRISFANQKSFPPPEKDRNFDSECLIFAHGDLWIFSKNNSVPFNGNANVYRFKFEKDLSVQLPVFTTIYLGNRGYYFDTPTAGDFQHDKFYLLTYNRWMSFQLEGSNFKLLQKKKFSEYNQKEALTIKGNSLWIANEYNKLLGVQKIKRIPLKKP
jgi:hypothetical protein